MKHKHAWLWLAVLGGCERLPHEQPFTYGKLGRISQAVEGQDLLWERRGVALFGPAGSRERLSGRDTVMVSFGRGSILGGELALDEHVQFFYRNPQSGDGIAVIEVQDQTHHDQLAMAAHSTPGYSCGNIERLPLNFSSEVDDPTPPLFSEHVKLAEVSAIVDLVDGSKIEASVQTLEDLGSRYHTQSSGKQTPGKIQTMIEGAIDSSWPLSISVFEHQDTEQDSLVATLTGQEDDDTVVIVGAHLDSINKLDLTDAPGADDDASGIATMVEVMRALSFAGASFSRRVEFHAYAAEEVGLWGSKEIAQQYRSQGRKVAAMLQLDMTAFPASAGDRTIFLVTTDTSASLRRSSKDLLHTYLGGDFEEKTLRAGISDHIAWKDQGYQAVFAFEDPEAYNKALHTKNDLSSLLDFELSARFAKLTVAFLGHHAGLTQASRDYTDSITTLQQSISSDLKVAIAKGTTADTYTFSISGGEDLAAVEICPVAAAGSADCTAARETFTASEREGSTRKFFAADAARALAVDDRFQLMGYDASEDLIARRVIRVTK